MGSSQELIFTRKARCFTADINAKEVIAEYNREEQKQSNSRGLWQDTGNHMWPYVQINGEFSPGSDRMQYIKDMTPTLDMQDMVSGFKQVLVPAGQTFFIIKVPDRYSRSDVVQRYLSMLTETSHEKIFASNFPTKIDDILISMIVFGPGSIFVEWKKKKGLNYKTSKIGSYVIIEDDSENVIGSIHKFKLTAQQAYSLYGDKAGKSVIKAMDKPETRNNEFWFLYKVVPRQKFKSLLPKRLSANMPYDACVIAIEDIETVDEGGFPENPYAIGRWMRPGYEKDGRGIGTEMLPQIKILYEMVQDLKECGNKWNNPPRQALVDGVEGEVRTGVGKLNWVREMDNIKALDSSLNGNFPITKDILEMQQDLLHRAFFQKAFDPLSELKGDRRTTLEIQERIRGTLKRLGPPVGRLWGEILTKMLERSVLLLIRNHEVEQPPDELAGVNFGIEYIGPLALALKSEQARGFQEWINVVAAAHAAFPDKHLDDNVDFDDAIPRLGRTYGANIEDIATVDERDVKRQTRAQELQQQQAMMAVQAGSKAIKDTSKKPEEGSPAEAAMSQLGGG